MYRCYQESRRRLICGNQRKINLRGLHFGGVGDDDDSSVLLVYYAIPPPPPVYRNHRFRAKNQFDLWGSIAYGQNLECKRDMTCFAQHRSKGLHPLWQGNVDTNPERAQGQMSQGDCGYFLPSFAALDHKPGGATPPGTSGGSASTISSGSPTSAMSDLLRSAPATSLLLRVPFAETRILFLRPKVRMDSLKWRQMKRASLKNPTVFVRSARARKKL